MIPKNLYIFFNLFALFLISYIGVDTFYRAVRIRFDRLGGPEVIATVTPGAVHGKVRATSTYDGITTRNIFGAVLEGGAKEEEEILPAVDTLEETSLKLKLLGTIAGDRQNGRAIIMDEVGKKQNLYREGDSVQGAVVQKILRARVVLKVGDRDEVLTMDVGGAQAREIYQKAKSAAKGGTVVINRADMRQTLGNMQDLLKQMRIRPYFRAGKPAGLLVDRIQADSIMARMGLKDGDIIEEINNRSISSPEDMMSFYKRLKSDSRITVRLNRRGRSEQLNFTIK